MYGLGYCLVPKNKGMTQGIEYFKETRWQIMLFLQHYNLKLWIYWFQRKRMSMPWTGTLKNVIFCRESVWDGLRCNRWIASNDLKKRHLLKD